MSAGIPAPAAARLVGPHGASTPRPLTDRLPDPDPPPPTDRVRSTARAGRSGAGRGRPGHGLPLFPRVIEVVGPEPQIYGQGHGLEHRVPRPPPRVSLVRRHHSPDACDWSGDWPQRNGTPVRAGPRGSSAGRYDGSAGTGGPKGVPRSRLAPVRDQRPMFPDPLTSVEGSPEDVGA
jgi:hypothetical protein